MNRLFILENLRGRLKFKNFFKEEDSRFVLGCALKITAVTLFVQALIVYLIWVFISFNNIFFEANGFPIGSDLQQVFFDSVLTKSWSKLQFFLAYLIGIFWIGAYIGNILLRPFRIIGTYCENVVNQPNSAYEPNAFSEFRLLTRFSEFFFQYLLDKRKKGVLSTNSIPPQYQKIRKPVFDKVFFFHYFLIIIAIAISSSYMITMTIEDIYESTITLALQTLKIESSSVAYFLQNQQNILDSLTYVTLFLVFTSYVALAIHFYGKVAGPAFGFFTTMRAFMNGKYYSRVHLLGFAHIRPYSRMFNKYLDYVERENTADK